MHPNGPWSWRSWRLTLIFLVVVLILQLFPSFLESVYSRFLYPPLSWVFRYLLGRVPFSVGDVVYFIIACLAIGYLVLLVRLCLKHNRRKRSAILAWFAPLLKFILWVYIVFCFCWGFNYSRQGITSQIGIKKYFYSRSDLVGLGNALIDRMNDTRMLLGEDSVLPGLSFENVKMESVAAYRNLSGVLPFLSYRFPSIKSSLVGRAFNMSDFTGYYNPFTGEAQLRTDLPRLVLPFLTCHEMAHQLGYASEDEANFIGYLACVASADPYFRYSAYLEMFSYVQEAEVLLYFRNGDTTGLKILLKENRQRVQPLVLEDRKRIRDFFDRGRNRLAPIMTSMYDKYLKLNHQKDGADSYMDVVSFLCAFRNKYGKV